MVKMNEDLKMITNKMATNERVDVAVKSSKVLKNSPAFS